MRTQGHQLEPIPRGELPGPDRVKELLHELCRFLYFKRELPAFPVTFQQKAPTTAPFDCFHTITSTQTPRDLETKNERQVPIPPR
jgi:hypothetical protein